MTTEEIDLDTIPDYVKARVLVLGCGNVLFGDDGFGPELAKYYNKTRNPPADIEVMDAHTTVRKLLFNILLSEDIHPKTVIIVDAVDKDREPGEVWEINLDDIPFLNRDNFSMHEMPSSNLLAEMKNLGKVDIRILVCQVKEIPPEIRGGLSEEVQKAIPKACDILDQWISEVE